MALLTYEDFQKVENDDQEKIKLILRAIGEHKRSQAYIKAVEAQDYYNGENTTIMKYEKVLYDMQGMAHVDMWTANHKIASSFFTFVIDQELSYLLGNGVRFGIGHEIRIPDMLERIPRMPRHLIHAGLQELADGHPPLLRLPFDPQLPQVLLGNGNQVLPARL